MNAIEKEMNKILKDYCPVKKIAEVLETSELGELDQGMMLDSIEVLRMHEDEIRKLRHKLELNYRSEVLKRYLKKKKSKKRA